MDVFILVDWFWLGGLGCFGDSLPKIFLISGMIDGFLDI